MSVFDFYYRLIVLQQLAYDVIFHLEGSVFDDDTM